MRTPTTRRPFHETIELVPLLRRRRWRRRVYAAILLGLSLALLAVGAQIGLVSWLRHRLHPLVALIFVHSLGQPAWVAGIIEDLLAGVLSPLLASVWVASWLPGWRPDPWRGRSARALGCLAALLAVASLVRLVRDVDENGQPNHIREVRTLADEEAFDYRDGRAQFGYETDGNGRIHLWPAMAARSPSSGRVLNPATTGIISQWRQQQRDAETAQRLAQATARPAETVPPLAVQKPSPTPQVAAVSMSMPSPTPTPAPVFVAAISPNPSPTPASSRLWTQAGRDFMEYEAQAQRSPTPFPTPSSYAAASPTPTPRRARTMESFAPSLTPEEFFGPGTPTVVRRRPAPADDEVYAAPKPARVRVYAPPPAPRRTIIVRPPAPVYRTLPLPPPRRPGPFMVPRFYAPMSYPRVYMPFWMPPRRSGRRF